MAYNKVTKEYLKNNEYQNWSLIGYLQEIATKVTFTSINRNEISETFLRHLKVKIDNVKTLDSVKHKAEGLVSKIEETWRRNKEVITFMKKQDLKATQVNYILNFLLLINKILIYLCF
jgi:hypothetical protein